MFFIDLALYFAATTWWDRNFIYFIYGIVAVTLGIAFFVLRRKDESSTSISSTK